MSEEDQKSASDRTVVVAEDESLIRIDVIETLRDNGFTVVGEAARMAVHIVLEERDREAKKE